MMTKEQMTFHIDKKADDVRRRIIGDPARLPEYEYTGRQAREFKASGYDVSVVPPTVKSWAQATGMTYQQACDNIIGEADMWEMALFMIREIRLKAKQQIINNDNPEPIYEQALVALNQILEGAL